MDTERKIHERASEQSEPRSPRSERTAKRHPPTRVKPRQNSCRHRNTIAGPPQNRRSVAKVGHPETLNYAPGERPPETSGTPCQGTSHTYIRRLHLWNTHVALQAPTVPRSSVAGSITLDSLFRPTQNPATYDTTKNTTMRGDRTGTIGVWSGAGCERRRTKN